MVSQAASSEATSQAASSEATSQAIASWDSIGLFYFDAKRVHQRQLRRLREIASFFDDGALARLLVPVATATFDVSLRLLDYCCTNYAKKTRVVICEEGMATHLFSLYKDWLRHYRRRCFDPFRRRERICFKNPHTDEWLATTVAQLNFLRWADVYKVIAYVRRNLQAIEQDMMLTLTESKKRRQQRGRDGVSVVSGKRKRAELSQAPRNKWQPTFLMLLEDGTAFSQAVHIKVRRMHRIPGAQQPPLRTVIHVRLRAAKRQKRCACCILLVASAVSVSRVGPSRWKDDLGLQQGARVAHPHSAGDTLERAQ